MIDRNISADPFNFKEIINISNKAQYSYVKQALTLLADYLVPQKLQNLYLSFNGGKDATIVLFLTLILLKNSNNSDHVIKCIHFSEPESFQQINAFIEYIREEFNIEWIELQTKKYAQQLKKLSLIKPIKYIIMGTRKDDPYCQNLGKIAPSDTHKGYPQFIRINPIFQWSYEQVWDFIIGFNIPYCKLYDQGYTYLGNKTNTAKNNELFDKQAKVYSPASKGKSEIQRKSRISQLTLQFTSQ